MRSDLLLMMEQTYPARALRSVRRMTQLRIITIRDTRFTEDNFLERQPENADPKVHHRTLTRTNHDRETGAA